MKSIQNVLERHISLFGLQRRYTLFVFAAGRVTPQEREVDVLR